MSPGHHCLQDTILSWRISLLNPTISWSTTVSWEPCLQSTTVSWTPPSFVSIVSWSTTISWNTRDFSTPFSSRETLSPGHHCLLCTIPYWILLSPGVVSLLGITVCWSTTFCWTPLFPGHHCQQNTTVSWMTIHFWALPSPGTPPYAGHHCLLCTTDPQIPLCPGAP